MKSIIHVHKSLLKKIYNAILNFVNIPLLNKEYVAHTINNILVALYCVCVVLAFVDLLISFVSLRPSDEYMHESSRPHSIVTMTDRQSQQSHGTPH